MGVFGNNSSAARQYVVFIGWVALALATGGLSVGCGDTGGREKQSSERLEVQDGNETTAPNASTVKEAASSDTDVGEGEKAVKMNVAPGFNAAAWQPLGGTLPAKDFALQLRQVIQRGPRVKAVRGELKFDIDLAPIVTKTGFDCEAGIAPIEGVIHLKACDSSNKDCAVQFSFILPTDAESVDFVLSSNGLQLPDGSSVAAPHAAPVE